MAQAKKKTTEFDPQENCSPFWDRMNWTNPAGAKKFGEGGVTLTFSELVRGEWMRPFHKAAYLRSYISGTAADWIPQRRLVIGGFWRPYGLPLRSVRRACNPKSQKRSFSVLAKNNDPSVVKFACESRNPRWKWRKISRRSIQISKKNFLKREHQSRCSSRLWKRWSD